VGKYRPLQDHLARQRGVVRMSFSELEQLVGELPPSARDHRPWWGNARASQAQARSWLNAGYRVTQVNLTSEWVEFEPDHPLPSERASSAVHEAQGRAPIAPAGDMSGAVQADAVDWAGVFDELASRLRTSIEDGLEHLLTEDVVRWELVASLRSHGVPLDAIRIEHQERKIFAKFDLVIGRPVSTIVELKYPRDPTSSGAADTMTTGELLRDFYRLAWSDIDDAWAVQILQPRLLQHLRRRSDINYVTEVGQALTLPAGLRSQLPKTAADALPPWTEVMAVVGECTYSTQLDHLVLACFRIRQDRPSPPPFAATSGPSQEESTDAGP
jgi:hypothetical protein